MFDARLLFNDGLGELVGRIVALHQILDQALPWKFLQNGALRVKDLRKN